MPLPRRHTIGCIESARVEEQAQVGPSRAAAETERPADVPAVRELLRLQRSAGNAAVSRLLARKTEYPDGKGLESGYWGRLGEGIPARELGDKIANDLLPEQRFVPAAGEVLIGYWIVDIVKAVERIRQLGKIDVLAPAVRSYGRVSVVVDMIGDPANFDPKTALTKINDREYADLTGLQRDGTPAPGAAEVHQIDEVRDLMIPIAMEQFAVDRQQAMSAATAGPPPAGPEKAQPGQSPAPGPQFKAAQDFDAKRLPALEKLTEGRKGPRWAHPDPKVADAVAAALQLRGVTAAMGQLEKGEGATADVHKEVRGKKPDLNWCGYFAVHELIAGGMSGKHVGALDSTSKVHAFFNYTLAHPDVAFPFMKDDAGELVMTEKYHKDIRHAPRNWIPTQDVAKDNLDIRPGDVLTLAVPGFEIVENKETGEKEKQPHRENPWGDHIVLVHSYDRAAGVLYTIGGNDGGYVVRNGAEPSTESAQDKAKREGMEAATGENLQPALGGHAGVGVQDLKHQATPKPQREITVATHVSGIGRLSIVDFEVHEYASDDPAAKKKK